MPPPRTAAGASGTRRPARDIIDAVVDNMRQNLEPLKYSTLAPSRYIVYLHPNEYARLDGIIPILQEQTTRALAEELARLNRRVASAPLGRAVARGSEPEISNAGPDWQVEFLADPDGDMSEGDLLIDSELAAAGASPTLASASARAGSRRFTPAADDNARTDGESHARLPRCRRSSPGIEYDDDAGHHSCDVAKDSVTIGRGGIAYPVDIRIASSPDVSREHARIRRDPKTGRFFLIDLSSLGTTLNGRHVPQGLRRGGWNEAGERRRNRAARHGANRAGRPRLSRLRDRTVMALLLWARLIFPLS